MPPRHGKSLICSTNFPLWYLGRNPTHNVIFTSYGQQVANNFGYKVKTQMLHPIFKTIFPEVKVAPESFSKKDLKLQNGGSYYAVGAGGPLTSLGGDLIIIDDPIKNRQDAESVLKRETLQAWYQSTLYTRQSPNCVMILIQTRWHDDDLAGWILKNDTEKEWVHLNLPAINEKEEALWPEQWPIEKLLKTKMDIGSREFSALYQQRPVLDAGGLFKRSWWRYYKMRPQFKRIVQFWDTAQKVGVSNDYSVCATWGEADDGYYLLDIWRNKVEAPELERVVKSLYDKHMPSAVVIEDKSSGASLIQYLRKKTVLPILAFNPGQRDKVIRASAITPVVESGRAFLPEGASFLEDFILEHELFPNTAHDDTVDSTSMALDFFTMRQAPVYRIRNL